jgi:hypothetical protein
MTKIVLCRVGIPGTIDRTIVTTPPLSDDELLAMALTSEAAFERDADGVISMSPMDAYPV